MVRGRDREVLELAREVAVRVGAGFRVDVLAAVVFFVAARVEADRGAVRVVVALRRVVTGRLPARR